MEQALDEQALDALKIDTSTDEGLNQLLKRQHQINAMRAVLELAQESLAKMKAGEQNEQ